MASGTAGAVLLAVPAEEVAASVATPVGRVPVWGVVPGEPAAALSAGVADGPSGGVARAPGPAVGRTGPGAGSPGTVVAGEAAVPLEPAAARWTLTAAPPARGAGLPTSLAVPADPVVAGETAVPPEPAAARWTLTAVPPELVAGLLPGAVEVGLPEAAGVPTGPISVDRSPSAVAPAEGAPGASRRATGSARRCTAGVADALVSEFGRWVRGGTGVTRGPAGRDAVTGRGARCTGTGTGAASSRTPPGVSGSSDRTGRSVCEGGSSPETGLADVVSAFLTSPPGAPSRTAWDRVPVKEGFCQVLSRPPKPESATPVRPTAARWIGGNPTQPPTEADPALMSVPASASVCTELPSPEAEFASATGSAPAPRPAAEAAEAEAEADAAEAEDVAEPLPLSRSKNPTPQPSAPPRVTRDAICSVKRRRSWCSRSRISSRPQWKW